MITPMTLHDSLCMFLEKEIAPLHKFKATDRNGVETFRHPQIVRSGWLLPRSIDEDSEAEEEFPYIVPRMEKLENVKGTRQSIVTMLILYGVYDPGAYDSNGKLVTDGSGYRDIWNLIESTRQALFQQLTLDNKYRLVDDFFEAELLTEQEYPYWEGFCKTKWHVAYPTPKLDAHFYGKGD